MLMMTPPLSCAPSISAACHDASIVPRRSTASTWSIFSARRERGAGAGEDVGARVVHPDVQAPERLAWPTGPSGAERLIVGQVEVKRGRAPSEGSNLALDFTRALFVRSIGDRDVGAGARGGERNRPADSARGARDEHGAAGERRGDGVGRHERVLYDPLRMVSNQIAGQRGEPSTLRLTSLSHGGGCGCKLAPAVLEQIIAKAGGAAGIDPAAAAGRHRDERRRRGVPDQ